MLFTNKYYNLEGKLKKQKLSENYLPSRKI